MDYRRFKDTIYLRLDTGDEIIEQIEIVATKEKLAGLGGQPMHVDTGDADADEYLKGYYKIIFKNSDSAIYKVG